MNCAVTKNRTPAPRPASAAPIARNADPCPILCIKAPCKVIATAVRDASFVMVVCDPCFWPCPAAARINSYRRPNVALRIFLSRPLAFARVIIRRPAHIVPVPISMMSTMRSEVGGRGRSVRAQEKISHSDPSGASVLSRCNRRLAGSVVVIRHLCDAAASRAPIKCLNRNRF